MCVSMCVCAQTHKHMDCVFTCRYVSRGVYVYVKVGGQCLPQPFPILYFEPRAHQPSSTGRPGSSRDPSVSTAESSDNRDLLLHPAFYMSSGDMLSAAHPCVARTLIIKLFLQRGISFFPLSLRTEDKGSRLACS